MKSCTAPKAQVSLGSLWKGVALSPEEEGSLISMPTPPPVPPYSEKRLAMETTIYKWRGSPHQVREPISVTYFGQTSPLYTNIN